MIEIVLMNIKSLATLSISTLPNKLDATSIAATGEKETLLKYTSANAADADATPGTGEIAMLDS
jgi:hypothetical protein